MGIWKETSDASSLATGQNNSKERKANSAEIPVAMTRKKKGMVSGQSDYPRTPQDTPRTPQDSIICMFYILYERVDDGLVLVCWCFN